MPIGTWHPTQFQEFSRRLDSSTQVCQITTDAGPAYIKCLGNREGPHAIACDWIGTRLAELMGMPTFDYAILKLEPDDVPFTGGREQAGPAMVTRAEDGDTWSKSTHELAKLSNPDDLAKLVVLDTWLRNRDRHSPNGTRMNLDNVFLSWDRTPGNPTLIAMDFSHAISNGREIDVVLNHRDETRDGGIYGLFDAFAPFITAEATNVALDSIGMIGGSEISDLLWELPREWEVGEACRQALRTFLPVRRDYLRETLFDRLSVAAGSQTAVEDES